MEHGAWGMGHRVWGVGYFRIFDSLGEAKFSVLFEFLKDKTKGTPFAGSIFTTNRNLSTQFFDDPFGDRKAEAVAFDLFLSQSFEIHE